jgi:hypothetical protein
MSRTQHPRTEEYLASLNEKEKKAYEIAKDHLGMSYDLTKSIGFISYCKKHPVEDLPSSTLKTDVVSS